MIRYRRWGCAGLAVLVLGLEAALVCLPWLPRIETALWLNAHVADHSGIAADLAADEVEDMLDKNLLGRKLFSPSTETWQWQFTPMVESESPSAWLGLTGTHYLVIDERTRPDESFSQRIQALVAHGATLLYQTPAILSLPRQAILWTFHPDQVLNITFNSDLLFIGYSVRPSATGGTTLLFHWYTDQPPTAAYHLFIHQVDPADGHETDLLDTAVGGDNHPTNRWRKGEIVFDPVRLPAALPPHTRIRVGLYDFETGIRAAITDDQQAALGDHIDFNLP